MNNDKQALRAAFEPAGWVGEKPKALRRRAGLRPPICYLLRALILSPIYYPLSPALYS